MAFDTNNLELHIKRVACSSIRICCRSACDYPIVLGAGILLWFLHRLCPSLFAFLLSSSPVFLLTALLLGALLIYGEPGVPVIEEETLKDQQMLPLKSKISITECSIEEVKNVTVEAHSEKTTDSDEVYVAERSSDDNMHVTHCEEKNVACMAADTVLSEEVYVKDKTSNYNLHDTHCDGKNTTSMVTDSVICVESSNFAESNVNVEREEHVGVNSENVELQESESTPESGYSKVQNQYQLGEFTSLCWQPVMRQDPCSDSESYLTESSPDASMTDIIPMFDELHPLIDLGTGHPSLVIRDNLNSSSDDDEDEDEEEEEEEDVSSDEEGAEGQKDDGNNWKDVIGLNSLDMEKNSKLENLMELQRAKNILKFELDKRLMNLQAADATQKLEASRFHVQVPSISAPRRNPFDPSNDSEEMIELPQILDSAPSVLLPPRNLFDLPFDQMVDHDSQLRETWTPRSYSPSTQHRKHGNLYGHHSTYLQHHNGIKLGGGEFSGKDACDSQSDYDAEQEGNNGKLFGSLEAHIGEEIKILSAAISDVGVLEVNYGMDEGDTNADFSDDINSCPSMKSVPSTLEVNDSVHAGGLESTTVNGENDLD